MPRRWAQLHHEDGSISKISIVAARSWLESGDVKAISQRPLMVTPVKHLEFDEELRFMSGRRTPGAHKGIFCGKYSAGHGTRSRPPRSAVNWNYVRTIGLVRANQQRTEERRDAERDRVAAREARRQAKRRRKQQKRAKAGHQDGRHRTNSQPRVQPAKPKRDHDHGSHTAKAAAGPADRAAEIRG